MFVKMEIIDGILTAYLDKNCDAEPPHLQRIHRETYLKETQPHMLSGHYQGRVLSMFSKLLVPRRILEIGTFTGYATLCLAEGLDAEGELHTIDVNEERQERVQSYFDESEYGNRIHFHIGDATEVIQQLQGPFDLVFIDADKRRNLHYYELMMERTRAGSVILIDNVLWKGRIFENNPDTKSRQILELNERLAQDTRVEKLILPIRDGMYVLRKK